MNAGSTARVAALVLGVMAASGILPAQPPSQLSPLAEAAKKRQARVRTLDITLVTNDTVERGGVSRGQGPRPGPDFGEQPPERVSASSRSKLILGDGVRFENGHPIWSSERSAWLETTKVSTFDGKLHKMHHPNGMGKGEVPDGFIREDTNLLETRLHWILPIMESYRGMSARITPFDVSRLKRSGNRVVRGRPCVLYEQKGADSSAEFLVDPEADHQLSQVRRFHRDALVYQIDIALGTHPELGQYPAAWEVSEFSKGGELLRTLSVKVENPRVNAESPPGTFDIKFTPGTMLTDMRTNRYGRIKEDGSFVDVDPGTGAEIGPGIGAWWPYAVSAAVLIVLFGGIWYSRRRAARPLTPATP